MTEKLSEKCVELLVNGLYNYISGIKKKHEWKKLFTDAGEFLINSPETSESFKDDLIAIFHKDNLYDISRKLKDIRGYNFIELLQKEVYDLMIRYEVCAEQAETYTRFFSQIILNYLEENDPDKTLEIYLGEWRKKEEERYKRCDQQIQLILKKLDCIKKENISCLTLSDIDAQIRRRSPYKGMSLDFFELDDEQFELDFQENINKEIIFVVGKSREETTYRILNELKSKNFNRTVFVITSHEDWNRLGKSNLKECILIPIFYAENIVAIPDNTNIFVYGEDEPCYSRDKLVLRKRTRKNIINSLGKIGVESNEAYNIVDKTHGLYSSLKKKLFREATHNEPAWVEHHSDVAIAALLCGKWTESDGDKIIFGELAGKDYEDCKKELLSYTYGESPYIVQIKNYHGNNMQIASIEDAWEEMDIYISDDIWEKFISLFYEVLIESEPIFEYPFEKHFEASFYAKKTEWSQTLKKGMLRTLVMRAYYRKHDENQRQIDKVIEKILATITTKERWGYISQYFTELCEASPKSILEKLEKEFSEPTGMLELFSANSGDFLTGRNYYTNILWAVEQLLRQKMYVSRAVEWLWKANEYNIKYNISNSPKSILELVFCAWTNLSILSVEDKIALAKKAVETYDNAWDIIYALLPNNRSICVNMCTPKYRSVEEPAEIYVHEVNKTYVEYLNVCVENINRDIKKWKKIIKSLHWYSIKVQKDIFNSLLKDCQDYSDFEKVQIKNTIRQIIYKFRFFEDSKWSLDEEFMQKYEDVLKNIVLDNQIYDFLYLFSPEHSFPLLNPVPYNSEDSKVNVRDANGLLIDKEINNNFQIFKDNNYSLSLLIKTAIKEDDYRVGEVLAKYYCNNIFDEEIFRLLLENDSNGKEVYNYVRSLYYDGNIYLREIIKVIKESTNNTLLVANIIRLQTIENQNNAIIIEAEDAIKREYWSMCLGVKISQAANEDVWIWALDECKKYGTISSYLELLFKAKEKVPPIVLLEKLLRCKEMQGKGETINDYYCTEVLKVLQKEFKDDSEKCNEIALLEWSFSEILEWNQMVCFQALIKSEPTLYTMLVKIVYRSDNEQSTEEKKVMANKIYNGFDKARFCPAEKDGVVKYEEIKCWIEKFKELLKQQGQERLFDHLLGRLLAFSPIGDDGYMPCEAVRKIIEENFSDDLKKSFVIAEENKRGVHTVDDGKSEKLLSENYKRNAKMICNKYPRTAEIYFALSNSYKWQAENERSIAEDVF